MDPHPLDDYVEATFAGRTWKLSLGLRAEVEFERRNKAGKTIGDALGRYFAEDGTFNLKTAISGFGADDFCLLVWCMTLRQQRDEQMPIALEDFIDMISVKDLQRMFREVMQAASAFRGTPHSDDPVPDPKEKNGRPLDRKTNGRAYGRSADSHSAFNPEKSRT